MIRGLSSQQDLVSVVVEPPSSSSPPEALPLVDASCMAMTPRASVPPSLYPSLNGIEIHTLGKPGYLENSAPDLDWDWNSEIPVSIPYIYLRISYGSLPCAVRIMQISNAL